MLMIFYYKIFKCLYFHLDYKINFLIKNKSQKLFIKLKHALLQIYSQVLQLSRFPLFYIVPKIPLQLFH